MLAMKMKTGMHFQGPYEFYSEMIAHLSEELHMKSRQKHAVPQELAGLYQAAAFASETADEYQKFRKDHLSWCAKSKYFAAVIPALLAGLMMLSHKTSIGLIESYAVHIHLDIAAAEELFAKAGRLKPGPLEEATACMGSVNNFIYAALHDVPQYVWSEGGKQIAHYLSFEVLKDLVIVSIMNLLAIRSTIESFLKSVTILRIFNGLAMGPLRLLEKMSEFD